MAARRQQTIALAGLVAILAMVIWWQFGRPANVPASIAAPDRAQRSPSGAPGQVAPALPQVSIALLQQARSEPVDTGRDLFKFASRTRLPEGGPVSGGPAIPRPAGAPSQAASVPTGGPADAAASLPPIPLRFIGLVQKQGDPAKIAVLSDARGVYHGREGDIIEGRYRIIRVGNESVEVAYVDGRGRQVLRLSGA